MYDHTRLTGQDKLTTERWRLIHAKKITLAGNKQLHLYGSLRCMSGKRMKKENRVFFSDEAEARAAGYRPCGHCLRDKYKRWKTAKDKQRNKRVSTG